MALTVTDIFAVTPPAARDLLTVIAQALEAA